jgi:hypothetical protein
MSQDDRNASAAVPCADGGHLNSGIVVFSSTRKALYVNEAGQQLLSASESKREWAIGRYCHPPLGRSSPGRNVALTSSWLCGSWLEAARGQTAGHGSRSINVGQNVRHPRSLGRQAITSRPHDSRNPDVLTRVVVDASTSPSADHEHGAVNMMHDCMGNATEEKSIQPFTSM